MKVKKGHTAAWQVLVERANLRRGQKALIHAGSGGVGTPAIQLAKHIGATVATTTSTANVDAFIRRKQIEHAAEVAEGWGADDGSHEPARTDAVLSRDVPRQRSQ